MPRRNPVAAAEPAAPRSRKGERTRTRLLEAAKTVFENDGFLDARISDIAAGAELSHGSFYHYFDSKEQIFRMVAEEQEALLTAATSDSSDSATLSEMERIRRANRRYLERYRDAAKIMGVIEEVSRYDEQVNTARMNRMKHFAQRAERSIRRMQTEGVADATVSADIAAVALGAMVARFAELTLLQHYADFDFDESVEELSRLWANAIGLAPDAAPVRAAKKGTGSRKTAAAR